MSLELAATIASTAYAVWKLIVTVSKLYEAHEDRTWEKILRSVNAAVNTVYVEVVRDAKLGNADGKLTPIQRRNARTNAAVIAADICDSYNIDLKEKLPPDELMTLIDDVVRARKTK